MEVDQDARVPAEADSYCDVCDVSLPTAKNMAEHCAGRKHQSMTERRQAEELKAARSVFLIGITAETRSEDVEAVLTSTFGSVDNVRIGPKKTTAIVEFTEPKSASAALDAKSVRIGNVVAGCKRLEKVHKEHTKAIPKVNSGPSPSRMSEDGAGNGTESMLSCDNMDVENVLSESRRLPAELEDRLLSCSNVESQIEALSAALCFSDEDFAAHRHVTNRICFLFKTFIAGDVTVKQVGSTANGFGMLGGDLDLVLLIPAPDSGSIELCRSKTYLVKASFEELSGPLTKLTAKEVHALHAENAYDCMRLLSRLLKLAANANPPELKDTLPLYVKFTKAVNSKRCPLINIVTNQKFGIELSLNNHAALLNTEFFANIASADGRFPALYRVLRVWSISNCELFSQKRLSNYALLLLVTVYLQHSKHLTSLKLMREKDFESRKIGEFEFGLPSDLSHFSAKPTTPVCMLLQGFFQFYSKLVLSKVVLCPLEGRALLLSEMEGFSPEVREKFRLGLLNIQDPFVLDHNTACGSLSKDAVRRFEAELQRAAIVCSSVPYFEKQDDEAWGILRVFSECPNREPIRCSCFLIATDLGSEQLGPRLLSIFTDVLGFGFSGNVFEATAKTWLGRRKVHRKIAKDHPGLDHLDLERKVTCEVMRNCSGSKVLTFRLAYFMLGSKAFVKVFCLQGADQDFVDFCHFLDIFLCKLF